MELHFDCHYVILILLGGAEHTRVIWDLASVTCLGIFCVLLMSFTLTTTMRVRNSALEVGLLYDSDLSRLLVGRKIIVDKEVERSPDNWKLNLMSYFY